MSRLPGAIESIRIAVATAAEIPLDRIGNDDDLAKDLELNPLQILSVCLIVEEIFSISIPDSLLQRAAYRTPAALAEWAIRESNAASYLEAKRQCARRA